MKGEDIAGLNDPSVSQPICTALQVAIVQLLRSWNIKPIAVAGHSSGEIAAAYCAGMISRQSAWKVAFYRGLVSSSLRCRQEEPEGMMAVGLSEIDIRPYLTSYGPDNLTVSCINSPQSTTVSGKKSDINLLQERLLQDGVMTHILEVEVAYHSRSMNAIAADYLLLLGDLQLDVLNGHSPMFFSSVSGGIAVADELGAQYWVSNMIQPVRFSKAVTEMCRIHPAGVQGHIENHTKTPVVNHIVEIGPHAALRRPIVDILTSIRPVGEIEYDSILIKGKSALESSLAVAGRLYTLGHAVDLAEVNCLKNRNDLQMLNDLPEYTFNHGQRYWMESRLSRNFRFRGAPEHELLGVAVPDWNPLDARWRKVIRLSETGWLAEHKIEGVVLYPAAGVIVMAIEAARTLVSTIENVKGYRLRDTKFIRPMTLPSADSDVEIETCLRPHSDLVTKSSSWWDFKMYMLEKDEWLECAHGTVIAEYEVPRTQLDDGREQESERFHHLELHQRGASRCHTVARPEDLYDHLRCIGLDYGPAFQVLKDLAMNPSENEAIANVSPCNWESSVPGAGITRPVIHPSALDGIFQLTLPALSRGRIASASIMLPSQMESLWITANGIEGNAGSGKIHVHAKGGMQSFRDAEFSMIALDTTSGAAAIIVDCFKSVSLPRSANSTSNGSFSRLCYNIDWKPDPVLLSNQEMEAYCVRSSNDVEIFGTGEHLDLIIYHFVLEALNKDIDEKTLQSKPHLRNYITWMHYTAENFDALCSQSGSHASICRESISDSHLLEMLEKSEAPRDKIVMRVGKSLQSILSGKADALQILYGDTSLLESLYDEMVKNTASSRLASYLDIMAHKSPDMNVLEIGAGMGSFTKPVIDTLISHGDGERGTPRFASYTFTDVSPTFFEKAPNIFRGDEDRLIVKTLNIEQDPLDQGFKEHDYDLILASNVSRWL